MGAWLCAWVLLGLGPDAPSHADGETAAPARAQRVTLGVDPAAGLDHDALTAVLRSHLSNTGLALELVTLDADAAARPGPWASARAASEARAVFVLSAEPGGGVRLQLTLPGDGGAWSRSLPQGDDDDDDATMESIGVMVRAMATSIEPVAIAAPREPPPPGPAPPRPVTATAPATAQHGPHVDLALGYAGSNVSAHAPWHSALALRAHVVALRRLTAMLGAAWAPTQRAGSTIAVARVALDVGLGATGRPGARVRPWLGGGLTLEALGWRVVDAAQGWGARVGVHAVAGLDVALSRRVGLLFAARLDVWCRNARIVIDPPQGRRELLRGHPAALAAFAGVRVRLGRSLVHPPRPPVRHGGQ